ncbi:MAG: hypothetical protein M0Z64_03560, partial [Nitrospiraceae bacterium]|nr:hypothetical protein [Nitrospiraceae bacterium]
IEVDRLKSVEEQDRDIRKIVKRTYFNAVAFSKGELNKLKAKDAANMKKTKRIIRSIVDLVLEEEQLLIGMTAIKDYDEYTYHHSVNVSVLSIALGQRLGLSKKSLIELGIAALPPDRALLTLMQDSGKKVDALLMKFFINMVGVFPVGTLVMLNTQELGIVCENNPLFIDRPKVCIIADEKGTKSDYIVDLSERTPDGRYARNIIKTLDSNKYRINLAEHLFVSHPGPFRQMEN